MAYGCSRVFLTMLGALYLSLRNKPCMRSESDYYNIYGPESIICYHKTDIYPFHQPYSICPSPLPAFNATGKSPRGGEKVLREKMCSHTLNKGSVLLVPPMTFIFCQTNVAKKMNASGDALSPCSSESWPLLCALWREATVKEQSGEYVGALQT